MVNILADLSAVKINKYSYFRCQFEGCILALYYLECEFVLIYILIIKLFC